MRNTLRLVLAAVCVSGAFCGPAWAWGPRAKQSIAMTAMQLVRTKYPEVFQPGETPFEEAIVLGAKSGYAALEGRESLNTDSYAIQAVGSQMQLLRDIHPYGLDLYYAYRMGVLASLVADTSVPFGFAWNAQEIAVQEKINEDIDTRIASFSFKPRQKTLEIVQDVPEYYSKQRLFYADDRRIIADDYQKGIGYNGMLKNGAEAYFSRSIEMVADIWNTLLAGQGPQHETPSSARVLKWYFADEITYLLANKRFAQAESKYADFASIQYLDPAIYEALGDAYYSSEAADMIPHAIREWSSAYKMAGDNRNRVAEKLVSHFIGEGRAYLDKASKPGAEDQDLLNALNALESALRIDNGSKEIADLIRETKVKQKEREEHLLTITNLIAQGQQGTELGEKAEKTDLNDTNALLYYRDAIKWYKAVDDTFTAQAKTAKNAISDLERRIKKIFTKTIDKATEAVEAGDTALANNKHDDAINSYSSIEQILKVLPEDAPQDVIAQKTDMLSKMAQNVDKAKTAKVEFEKAKKAQEEAAKRKGAAPAAAAPAADGAAPAAPPGRRERGGRAR